MEKVKLPVHEHPLLPFTRFSYERCCGCGLERYIYGGYRCNELGCQWAVFHRECVNHIPKLNYCCPPLKQLTGQSAGHLLKSSRLHQHPLELFSSMRTRDCKLCHYSYSTGELCYGCYQCELVFHAECAEFFPEAYHTSHPQHPLKLLAFETAPDYADEKCLLCERKFDRYYRLHHCDVCNFSICRDCMTYPLPVRVESSTTHEHELHLVPRRIDFTCNACGTLGDRSPYFCLQCNFMIHRQCIDLPRVIHINRHDHRISYTPRLGHHQHGEEWKCKVCRKKVDGFYGAYTCVKKCPSLVVHSRCATRNDVWDMVELEGTPDEEEELPPFEVIDEYTIKHFSHDHNLIRINEDDHDRILPDNVVCEACLLQIISEQFYSCEQCHFILHEKCANHPRKKRHFISNLPFTLLTDSRDIIDRCWICEKSFTGFRYKAGDSMFIDARCAAISDTLEHGSHQYPLYYCGAPIEYNPNCSRCGEGHHGLYRCDECDYTLDGECAHFPEKVMRNRYDDHPLVLSFGDMDVDGEYWCEACETKLNPKEWFYTCHDCGTILHIHCVVGDFSYTMPGSIVGSIDGKVVFNTSVCRLLCSTCNTRCKLPSMLKLSRLGVDEYFCSYGCFLTSF